jgi:hypothetical protein
MNEGIFLGRPSGKFYKIKNSYEGRVHITNEKEEGGEFDSGELYHLVDKFFKDEDNR